MMLEGNKSQKTGMRNREPDTVPPTFTCPVCGNPLGELNLPCEESVVDEKLYSEGDIYIINSDIVVKCEFDHCRNEEDDTPLDDPHPLVSVIAITFDSQGNCTRFVIEEIHPAKVCK